MTPRVSTRKDTRLALLEAGINAMFEKGYTNTGISEVLKSVGVPKGSFYHYFDSKEEFALEIINEFDQEYRAGVLSVLSDKTLAPTARLKRYCKLNKEKFFEADCKRGCIIGNLSQEMSGQSERLRDRLREVMNGWRLSFAECIREGQESGEFSKSFDAEDMAEFFICGWQGAVMRAKTTQDLRPLDNFIELMFEGLLKK